MVSIYVWSYGGLPTSICQQQRIFVDAILRRLVCEQEVPMEVVCTNIDNNQLRGSGPAAPTYQPAAELSGAQFEIVSGAQFENTVGLNHE
ncbi:hypothetical protein E2C01_034799 [Portunus trituberculatus]|uniref:Uncharacterized protein n=1 Tax=Portunus trituberculatus TaxID=210409 RepID=A0A5B7F3S8_PORTR|nr:hypothetical protein [Portunus trituberculatus]